MVHMFFVILTEIGRSTVGCVQVISLPERSTNSMEFVGPDVALPPIVSSTGNNHPTVRLIQLYPSCAL